MSGLGAPYRPDPPASGLSTLGAASAVVGSYLVLGLLGALLWWQVTTLPYYVVVEGEPRIDPVQLTGQVAIDGWFAVIAAVAGLVTGAVFAWWRRRDPMGGVVWVAIGSMVAMLVMRYVGLWLGPAPERTVARTAAEGARISLQLDLHATGVMWLWPFCAMFGSLAYLWITRPPATAQPTLPAPVTDPAESPTRPPRR